MDLPVFTGILYFRPEVCKWSADWAAGPAFQRLKRETERARERESEREDRERESVCVLVCSRVCVCVCVCVCSRVCVSAFLPFCLRAYAYVEAFWFVLHAVKLLRVRCSRLCMRGMSIDVPDNECLCVCVCVCPQCRATFCAAFAIRVSIYLFIICSFVHFWFFCFCSARVTRPLWSLLLQLQLFSLHFLLFSVRERLRVLEEEN